MLKIAKEQAASVKNGQMSHLSQLLASPDKYQMGLNGAVTIQPDDAACGSDRDNNLAMIMMTVTMSMTVMLMMMTTTRITMITTYNASGVPGNDPLVIPCALS